MLMLEDSAIDVLDDEEAPMPELLGDEFVFASASDRIARLEAAGTNV